MKNKAFYSVICITTLIFGICCSQLTEIISYGHFYHSKTTLSEKNKIYFHSVDEHKTNEDIFLFFDELYHFGDRIDHNSLKHSKESIYYPYIGISFSNYILRGEEEYNMIDLVVEDSQIKSKLIEQDKICIFPYYKEDCLDENLQKCFISKELNNLLKTEYDVDCVNKEITINNVRIPTSQYLGNELIDSTNGTSKTIYPYTVNYVQDSLTFEISEVADNFYSSIYKTSLGIIIPHTMLDEILEEYQASDFLSFNPGVYVAFSNDKINQETIDHIESLDPSIETYSYGYSAHQNLEQYIENHWRIVLFLNGGLMIGLFLNYVYLKNNIDIIKNEFIYYFFTVFITSGIIHFILCSNNVNLHRLGQAHSTNYILVIGIITHIIILSCLWFVRYLIKPLKNV